jgi:putative hemolysin
MHLAINIFFIVLFILFGALFAATETSLLSLRKSQIERLAEKSKAGKRVKKLTQDPNRFLSAAQIGVTTMGFFSASFGATAIVPDLSNFLKKLGVSEAISYPLSFILLTLLIAYVSVIIGELVPKRIALEYRENVALTTSGALNLFATLVHPLIVVLSKSTNAISKLFGVKQNRSTDDLSDEEIKLILATQKTLKDEERKMLTGIFDAEERSLSEIMRPRKDVVFLEGETPLNEAWDLIKNQPYSRYPVLGDSFDNVLGFVHVRDLLQTNAETNAVRNKKHSMVKDVARKILVLPATNHLLPSLSVMRNKQIHIAIVVDEYGGTDGIVTMEDILEELIGDIQDEYDLTPLPEIIQQPDGSISIDAQMNLEDFEEQTGIELEDDGSYETVAGFVVAQLGKIAKPNDTVKVPGFTLTVTKVDGHSLTRITVTPSGDDNLPST